MGWHETLTYFSLLVVVRHCGCLKSRSIMESKLQDACWRCKTTQLAMETRPEAEEATGGDVSVEHDGKIGTPRTVLFYFFVFSLFSHTVCHESSF